MADRWVTFDCYGTLIDWDGGVGEAMERLWLGADRARLLRAYHAVEPLVQEGRDLPYREVLRRSLRAVAGVEDLPLDAGEDAALAESLPVAGVPRRASPAAGAAGARRSARDPLQYRPRPAPVRARADRGAGRPHRHRRGLRLLQARPRSLGGVL